MTTRPPKPSPPPLPVTQNVPATKSKAPLILLIVCVIIALAIMCALIVVLVVKSRTSAEAPPATPKVSYEAGVVVGTSVDLPQNMVVVSALPVPDTRSVEALAFERIDRWTMTTHHMVIDNLPDATITTTVLPDSQFESTAANYFSSVFTYLCSENPKLDCPADTADYAPTTDMDGLTGSLASDQWTYNGHTYHIDRLIGRIDNVIFGVTETIPREAEAKEHRNYKHDAASATTLTAFNNDSGEKLWDYKLKHDGFPMIVDNKLIVVEGRSAFGWGTDNETIIPTQLSRTRRDNPHPQIYQLNPAPVDKKAQPKKKAPKVATNSESTDGIKNFDYMSTGSQVFQDFTFVPRKGVDPIYGDINNDGYLDALFPMILPGGNEGYAYSLHVWDPQANTARQVNGLVGIEMHCGDVFNSITINTDGTITGKGMEHSPEGPCADGANIPITITYVYNPSSNSVTSGQRKT